VVSDIVGINIFYKSSKFASTSTNFPAKNTLLSSNMSLCFFLFYSSFILLSRGSDGGAIFWTNPHPPRSCPFPSFPVVSLTFYHLIW